MVDEMEMVMVDDHQPSHLPSHLLLLEQDQENHLKIKI